MTGGGLKWFDFDRNLSWLKFGLEICRITGDFLLLLTQKNFDNALKFLVKHFSLQESVQNVDENFSHIIIATGPSKKFPFFNQYKFPNFMNDQIFPPINFYILSVFKAIISNDSIQFKIKVLL